MIKLVDGSNMLHRSMYGAESKLGIHPLRENYLRFMGADHKTMVIWDGYNSRKRRTDLYPGYKQRPEKGEDIKASFDIMKELLCHCPVTQMEIEGWEADDVIYTLTMECVAAKQEVTIESNDQDFWQLANQPGVHLPLVHPLSCAPERTCIYKALCGDTSDTIGGWRGFGPARFQAMEEYHDQIENALHDKDWNAWQQLPWPKGVTVTEESFFQCCIFYQIVQLQIVPEEAFKDAHICGKSNPALAEEIFARWRI